MYALASSRGSPTRPRRSRGVLAVLVATLGACEDVSPAPDPSPDPGWRVSAEIPDQILRGVWAEHRERVYAVGGRATDGSDRGTPFILRFDGTLWDAETLPDGVPMLEDVHGFGDVVWAVGHDGRGAIRSGGVWALTGFAGVDAPLRGIWGPRADRMWAVGGLENAGEPVLLEYDGRRWTAVELPALMPETHALLDVWGTADDDVYAVGQAGTVLHFDGSQWSTAQFEPEIPEPLRAVSGSGPDDVVVVGGAETAVVLRYDGSTWAVERRRLPALTGIWTDGEGRSTVVGASSTLVELAPGETRPGPGEDPGTDEDLAAVFGVPDGWRFVVGGGTRGDPPRTAAVVLRFAPSEP